MKNQDVLSKCMFKVTKKEGGMFDNGQIVVPMEYDYVSRAKENLFIGTKGSVNGYRTYGIETHFEERFKPYGEYFREQLKNKTLDTEVDFYTVDGQIYMKEKILACVACLNDDMIILLKEGYKWSIALIDYDNLSIREIDEYSNLEYLNSDYSNRRFIFSKGDKYSIVSFDYDSTIMYTTPMYDYKPVMLSDFGMIIEDHGKYGYMEYDGNVILPCTWDKLKLKKGYIEVVRGEKTAIYLYSGYCVLADTEIESYEMLYVKFKALFKVCYKNGYYKLFSTNKQLLPKEVDYLEIHPEGIAIINIPYSGKALVKYDEKEDKIIPVLPANCFDYKAKLFDNMSFSQHNEKTLIEVTKGKKIAYYDVYGKQLTRFTNIK